MTTLHIQLGSKKVKDGNQTDREFRENIRRAKEAASAGMRACMEAETDSPTKAANIDKAAAPFRQASGILDRI
jgi:hypothetical protein